MIQTPFRSLFTRYLPLFFLALVLLVSASGCNARWHLDGDNRAAHSAERVRTLQEQAEEGDANAQALLGFLYYRGSGVSQDYDQARKWFEKAAEQGDTFAQLGLGTIYSAGLGVDKDDAQAAKWYSIAAEQGNVGCQYRLGAMYSEGRGVEKCNIQAHKWLNLAAMRGISKAAALRDELEEKMTDAQIEEAQKRAREWMTEHGKNMVNR